MQHFMSKNDWIQTGVRRISHNSEHQRPGEA